MIAEAWKKNKEKEFANCIIDVVTFQTKNKLESNPSLALDCFFTQVSRFILVQNTKIGSFHFLKIKFAN
jgi:hypothetical protein